MAKAKTLKAGLPAGYKPITGGGDFAPAWDYEAKPVLEGTLISSKSVHIPARGKIKASDKKVYTIEQKDGKQVVVWESAGLRALSEVKKGARVAVAHLGIRKISGGRKFREFAVGSAGKG